MSSNLCERHGWSATAPTPCPDCAELAALRAKVDAANLQNDELRREVQARHEAQGGLEEKLQESNRLNGELQKELAELRHTGQHMTCGQCEQLRETQKRLEPSSMICDSCGWNNGPYCGGGIRKMYTMGKITKCGECLPQTR